MSKLLKIQEFISGSPQGTIFTTPDWLEAVAPGQWEYIVLEDNNNIKACIPVVSSKKYGFNIIKMPALTQSLGVMLPPEYTKDEKYAEKITKINNILLGLIPLIPGNAFFSQRFHPTITNWLPFYWNGFNQSTRYTYILNNLSELDKIWEGMRSSTRREIRKAQKQLTVENNQDLESLKSCISDSYSRQASRATFPFSTLDRVFKVCTELDCGRVFLAKNNDGETCGAIYLVWDKNSAYYLAGGNSENFRSSGAMSLLLWKTIQFAAGVTHQFNFEGSMIKSIERFFRSFGGIQVPYFEISKTNSFFIKLSKLF